MAVIEVGVNLVDSPLAVAENEGPDRRASWIHEEVVTGLQLHVAIHENDVLMNVLVRRASTAHGDAVVLASRHVLPSEGTHLLGEGGGEHQVNMIGVVVGVATRHDHLQVVLPVHVQHLIRLIDNGVQDAGHGQNVRPAHEITKAARRGDEDVASLRELLDGDGERLATVGRKGAHHGTVA